MRGWSNWKFIVLVVLACACGRTSDSISSTEPPPCDGGACGALDAGFDAGPAIDLRFRGVGMQFQLNGGEDIGGAVGGPFTITTDSPAISIADTNNEGVFTRFFAEQVPTGPIYRSQVITDAVSCPDSLARLISENLVVLGIGGDPSIANPDAGAADTSARCALLGVGTPDAGPAYAYLTGAGTTLDDLAAKLAQNSSYVVTALSAPDSGVAYVAESIGPLADGGMESFETRFVTVDEVDLQAGASELADAGYAITAANAHGTQFILVGSRQTDSAQSHSAVVEAHPGSELGTIVPRRFSDGFAAVGFVDDFFGEADGGIGGNAYIIWEK
jgi:hypothetical protein